MKVEKKMEELGFELPEPTKPVAAYVPAVAVGNFVYSSGQVPYVKGELKYQGKVGKDLTLEEAYKASQICVLNCLAAVKSVIGDLDRIEQIVKVNGFVNSDSGFTKQPMVINGASELLIKIFGERGKHARAAIGTNVLPLDAAVEVEMIVFFSGDTV